MKLDYIDRAIASFDGTFVINHPMASPKSSVVSVLRNISCSQTLCSEIADALRQKSGSEVYTSRIVREVLLHVVGDRV